MNKLSKFVLLPLYDGFAQYDNMSMGEDYPLLFFKKVSFPLEYPRYKIIRILNEINNDILPDSLFADVNYDITIADVNSLDIYVSESGDSLSIDELIEFYTDCDDSYEYLKKML